MERQTTAQPAPTHIAASLVPPFALHHKNTDSSELLHLKKRRVENTHDIDSRTATDDAEDEQSRRVQLKKRRAFQKLSSERRTLRVQQRRRHNEKDGRIVYCDYCDLFISAANRTWMQHQRSGRHMDNMEAYFKSLAQKDSTLVANIRESVQTSVENDRLRKERENFGPNAMTSMPPTNINQNYNTNIMGGPQLRNSGRGRDRGQSGPGGNPMRPGQLGAQPQAAAAPVLPIPSIVVGGTVIKRTPPQPKAPPSGDVVIEIGGKRIVSQSISVRVGRLDVVAGTPTISVGGKIIPHVELQASTKESSDIESKDGSNENGSSPNVDRKENTNTPNYTASGGSKQVDNKRSDVNSSPSDNIGSVADGNQSTTTNTSNQIGAVGSKIGSIESNS